MEQQYTTKIQTVAEIILGLWIPQSYQVFSNCIALCFLKVNLLFNQMLWTCQILGSDWSPILYWLYWFLFFLSFWEVKGHFFWIVCNWPINLWSTFALLPKTRIDTNNRIGQSIYLLTKIPWLCDRWSNVLFLWILGSCCKA